MRSEAVVQQEGVAEFCRLGGTPWRNNSGACTDDNGRQIRYGLGNISKQFNDTFKSSDYIGIFPLQVYTERHGWHIIGVLTALEFKHEGWHLTPGDKRGQAQKRFIDIVLNAGGYAGFVSSIADLHRVLGLG